MTPSNPENDLRFWTDAIADAGIASPTARLTFHALPVNLERRDAETRRTHLVRENGEPIAHLTVGMGIKDLYNRSVEFARTHPELSPGHVHFAVAPAHEVVLRSYVQGIPLREALSVGSDRYEEGLNAVDRIREILDQAQRQSEIVRFQEELLNLEQQVLALPSLAKSDKAIIRETILPAIVRELADQPMTIRLAHGDLTAENILLRADDGPCLIDFEFSEMTHFHALEWVRLLQFSRLEPTAMGDLERRLPSPPLWARLMFWLRQITLEHAVNLPEAAATTLPSRVSALADIVRSDPRRFGRPLFLNLGPPAAPATSATSETAAEFAQLFWAVGEQTFNENQSATSPLRSSDASHTLEFPIARVALRAGSQLHLRFDPMARTGHVTIAKISILSTDAADNVLYSVSGDGFAGIGAAGTAIVLGRNPTLTLLSYGNDPQIHLSIPFPKERSTGLRIQIEFAYSLSLHALAPFLVNLCAVEQRVPELEHRLATATADLQRSVAEIQESRTKTAALVAENQQISALEDQLTTTKTDLQRSLTEIQESRTKIAELGAETRQALETLGKLDVALPLPSTSGGSLRERAVSVQHRVEKLTQELESLRSDRALAQKELQAILDPHAPTPEASLRACAGNVRRLVETQVQDLHSLRAERALAQQELQAILELHALPPEASLRACAGNVRRLGEAQLQDLHSLRAERALAHQELQSLFASHHDTLSAHRTLVERARALETDLVFWRDRYHQELFARRRIDRSWEWKLGPPLRDLRRAFARFGRLLSKREETPRSTD